MTEQTVGRLRSPGTAHFATNGTVRPTYGIVRPHSIYDGGSNNTYIVYQGDSLDPYAVTFDHDTGEFVNHTKVADNPLGSDAHGAPSIEQDSGGTLHTFYGSHASAQKYATSDTAGDTSSWTVQSDIGSDMTYPKPVFRSDLHLFIRTDDNSRDEAIWRSTDGGSTWSEINVVIGMGSDNKVYTASTHPDGSDVHLSWNIYDSSAGVRENVYHAIYDLSDDSLRSVDGTSLSMPLSKSDADANCMVFDTESLGEQANVPRVAVDGNGTPHTVFHHENGGQWECRYSKWESGSWTPPETITTTGNIFTSASAPIVNSPSDIDLYVPESDPGASARGGDVKLWHYDGSAWSRDSAVLNRGDYRLNYPALTRGDSPIEVVFSETKDNDLETGLKVYAAGGSALVRDMQP